MFSTIYNRSKFHVGYCNQPFKAALKVVLTQTTMLPLEVFYKKDVLKNFAKFTGKHLCQGLFFNKVAGLWQLLLQKDAREEKKSSSFNRIYHLFLKKILAKSYECRHGRLVFNNWWIIKIIGRKWRSVFKIDNKNNDAWHLNLMHLHESRKFYTRVNNKKVNFFETAHSYCLFVSLKWFRKVHVRPFFNWWELSLLNL